MHNFRFSVAGFSTLDFAQLYVCPEPSSGCSIASRTHTSNDRPHPSIISSSSSIIHGIAVGGGLTYAGRNHRSYQPNYTNGVGFGGGTVASFGRTSPAPAHTTPLLATSASSAIVSLPSGCKQLVESGTYLNAIPEAVACAEPASIPVYGGYFLHCGGSYVNFQQQQQHHQQLQQHHHLRRSAGGNSSFIDAAGVREGVPEKAHRSGAFGAAATGAKACPQPAINACFSPDVAYPADKTTPQYHLQHHQQQHHSQHQAQLPQHDDSCEEFNNIPDDDTCLANKRMMVSKLWNSCFPEFTPEHVHRHNFYLCQWQRNTQVRIVYLFYRWLAAITCLAALVCSLLDIGRTDEHFENHYAKWWIYLTHWGLLFCTVQAWLAAWIVTQGMMVEREDFEIVRQAKKSKLHHIYWVMYTLATVYSFIITICYWLLVHNPEIHKVDALNIMVHVFNSVIMLFDLAIVGHPIKLSHAYFTTGVGLVYAIFTGIYFLAGGTDRKNQVAIYPMLDWTKPGKAIIVTACAIIFVFVVHFGCYLLYRARVWLFTKLCIRSSLNRDGEGGEGLNEDSSSRLGGGHSDYSHQQQYPIIHSEQPYSHQHHQQQQQQHFQYQQQTQHNASKQQHQSSSTAPHSVGGGNGNGSAAVVNTLSNAMANTLHQSLAHAQQPPSHTSPQYQPQYSGYAQQPVVAGVNVGVISAGGIYQDPNNSSSSTKGKLSSLSRSIAQLEASQHEHEQFLNANKIVEYKM